MTPLPARRGPRAIAPLRWHGGLTDSDARQALVRASYVVRLALALALVLLTHAAITTGLWLAIILTLSILTVGSASLALGRDLRRGRLPSQGALLLAASLDAAWLVLGYIATGYTAIPFLPLLALAIGLHGVLLSGPRTGVLAAVALALFVFASATRPWTVDGTAFTAQQQTAFFVAVGLVSAIVGNRIRAAGWAVSQLSDTVAHLSTQHQAVLEALPVGILVVNDDGTLREANATAGVLLGREPSGLDLAALRVTLAPVADAVEAVLAAPIGMPIEQSGEVQLAAMAGAARWIDWVVAAHDVPDLSTLAVSALAAPASFGSAGPAPSGPTLRRSALVVLADRTDRRAATEASQRVEHFAAIAALSAGLAHEVRNPVAALRSAAEQLAEARPTMPDADATLTPEDQATLLRVVVREADRLSGLVSEFLEFARVGSRTTSRIELAPIAEDAAEAARAAVARSGKRVTVRVEMPSLTLDTDAELLYRALSNLALNAAQFSPDGATVEILGVRGPDGRSIQVRVRDSGPGVPASERTRIFTPFFTTRPGGSGLGLAITARAATLLGGHVTCEAPAEGTGAVFCLELPLTAAGHRVPVSERSLS